MQELARNPDVVAIGVSLGAQRGNQLPVYGHLAGGDKQLGFAA
jgi:hypothetical protein